MEDLSLVFVNRIGERYSGEEIFNFFFSNTPDTVIGEYWDLVCLDMVGVPDKKYIQKVYTLELKDIELGILSEDESWRYLDGVYGIIALAYEFIPDYKDYEIKNGDLDIKLLKFFYGDKLINIKQQLKDRNLKFVEENN